MGIVGRTTPPCTAAAILSVLLLLAACQSSSGGRDGDRSTWGKHLAPLKPTEIVALDPHDSSDVAVMRDAYTRAGMPAADVDALWLASDSAGDRRGIREIMGSADGQRMRRNLRTCLDYAAIPVDTSVPQVLIVRVRVASDGVILEASVRRSTVEDSDVITCLMRYVVSWTFSEAADEETFDVPLGLVPGLGR